MYPICPEYLVFQKFYLDKIFLLVAQLVDYSTKINYDHLIN